MCSIKCLEKLLKYTEYNVQTSRGTKTERKTKYSEQRLKEEIENSSW